ncbi:NAD(P)-dependent oxidoreductase [Maridesulfovibrio ferrireducens]|uniref:NAD-dependent epimerase/dehydratase family protein n=1 Tax=Maridesulfovibrio ferrireducens TaxID=246191 RepID=UPI001A1E1E60|nr:NAD(P)-dependent oxidoreductase [Maridesulfovibrio ferrireducens]MBI9113108.1 NAD(P)-dependent oxidoreductase [Maridesulfovibrio ferrireducens]
MRILVTGATGFIGSYVVNELIEQGYEVTATTRNVIKNCHKSWFSAVDCKELDLAHIPDDIFSYLNRPERIIHLAWGGLSNYNDTVHTKRNYLESITFLKKMIEQGARHLLVSGTCFEYGLTALSQHSPLQLMPVLHRHVWTLPNLF